MTATSSSLTSLTRTPSLSFRTASEGAATSPEDVTDISSPGDAGEDGLGRETPYRDALDLPRELKMRCQIHIEEQYYVAALYLLNSLLCDGISHANSPTKSALVPPPGQLGVLATLAIHPKHTSKLTNLASHDVSSLSLSYLRNILATVGPVNANLRDAFRFRGDTGRRRRSSDDFDMDGSLESDEDYIRGNMANGGSVWARGQDFWKVLGWAFNCAALYPHRWRWWKPWLEFMLDVLEDDYEERKLLDEEREGEKEREKEREKEKGKGKGKGKYEYRMLRESLLVSYLTPKNSRTSLVKPIVSALFADGSSSSLSIYQEVFRKETRVVSKNDKTRKRGRVDLDNDNFGDYDDDSSTGGSQPPTPEHLRTSAKTVADSVPWTQTSLSETIPLRLRLFALLSRAGDDVRDQCKIELMDLYRKFVEKILQLPVPAFSKFIASHDSPLEIGPIVAIIRLMMPYLLPGSTPQPDKIDPEADNDEAISMLILEKCYMPFAYKSAENNAKLSLVVEQSFRILWTHGGVDDAWTPSFQAAVEKGVKARNEKSAPKKSARNKEDGEKDAREIVRASGNRILALAKILEMHRSVEGNDSGGSGPA